MTPTFRTEPPDIDHVLCRELSATADLGTLLTQPVQQGADRNSVPPRQRHRPHARCVVRQNRRLLTRQSLPRPTPSAQPRHLPRLRSRLQSRSLLRRARRRTGVAKVGIPSQRLRGDREPLGTIVLRGSLVPRPAEGLTVWAVHHIASRKDLDPLGVLAAEAAVAAVLVEPRVPGVQGGTGVALPAELAQSARERVTGARFALAGGLRPETLAGAIALVRPDIVDVSSGVESAPGIKDADLLARFLEVARDGGARA